MKYELTAKSLKCGASIPDAENEQKATTICAEVRN